ncbi:hypothetical protein NIES2098_36510 [Calothrix sp. NIES-2098]|nr:hypothetical protein NIES2098_36510 [Calothrix sp. NIES-2098]
MTNYMTSLSESVKLNVTAWLDISNYNQFYLMRSICQPLTIQFPKVSSVIEYVHKATTKIFFLTWALIL